MMSFVCDINAAQQWRMSAAWSTAQLGVLSVGLLKFSDEFEDQRSDKISLFFFLITRMFTLIPQVSTSVKLFSDSYFSRRQVYCIFSSSASLSLWTQGHFRWALWYINRHATIFISCFIGMLEGLHSTYFSFLIRFVSWGLEELSDLSYSMAMESPCF